MELLLSPCQGVARPQDFLLPLNSVPEGDIFLVWEPMLTKFGLVERGGGKDVGIAGLLTKSGSREWLASRVFGC